MRKFFLFCLLLITYNLQLTTNSNADTIHKNDGNEIKGIVVENYKDRVVFSTADGEVTVMKADIKDISYDAEEDNLVKLAEISRDRGDYESAFAYYSIAARVNPELRQAKDGIVAMQGYLFKKEEAKKMESIRRAEDLERQMGSAGAPKAEEDQVKAKDDALMKSLGIALKLNRNFPRISEIRTKSPAYEAGIREGDLLVSIWNRLTGYMPLKEVVKELLERTSGEIKCTMERVVEVRISDNRALTTSPEGLIGASLDMEFEGLTVTGMAKEGPSALESGLIKDDLITAIDGNSTRYMPINKAIEYIRNSKNNTIKLTIRRDVTIWRGEG